MIDFSIINFQIDKENKLEDYLSIFETIILSNSSKKLSEIIDLLNNLVVKKYIEMDILNQYLKSEDFNFYIKKYLKEEQIDLKIFIV
ncbi:hypothetical protein [Aliarcobacter butzleri]|uniref:hypothetical protein n=1 Tax=Aliarcobacter butzleri TaxID=28197 RepID=UPI00263E013C|nr:hypothetical protein [Aliarcobacter butzleri]MDN5088508.1 hypothetical protein [Aliarcobacter butzleri]